MAIKKSELYSSLWKSCDELRGGMDASQYKDYVLVMLFIKYISDRYADQPYAPIKIPAGASFRDMVALKGKPTIGDDINKKIIAPIADANKLSEMPDFNNPDKLGSGKDMVSKLSNLIAIFENPALDFGSNRADGDDILGDAYEYLMRHFATESGKSKGQFYTPAEVSRIMAKVIGISSSNTTAETSVYDPTCGSGSLLLKVADESEKHISIFGQEMDVATASLARMNMILHDNPTAVIKQGNTLANPLFIDANSRLNTFDYVVANPPFSYKSWGNGVNLADEVKETGRFYGYGVPPSKNGDYAFLLHIVKSMKSRGKSAVILPHGVLFRGNAEAEIRQNLIRRGIIKGIIGLPANLFYGTGIPACLIIMDKENAENRRGIFMIDASKGFVKDGNKNRLREQDILKIVHTFNSQIEIPKYSRMVSTAEIEEKEFNLNIPRYIDNSEPEDIQNIEAHLKGGIPKDDIDALETYWTVYSQLKNTLFKEKKDHEGFFNLTVPKENLKATIYASPDFVLFSDKVKKAFSAWQTSVIPLCKGISSETKPKKFIQYINYMDAFKGLNLIDPYDLYQNLMSYWNETMQDDCYLIVSDGWNVGKEVEWVKKDYDGKLIPKSLLIDEYFSKEKEELETLESERDTITAQIEELEENNSGDEGYFSDFDKVNKNTVSQRLKIIEKEKKTVKKTDLPMAAEEESDYGEIAVLKEYLELSDKLAVVSKAIKDKKTDLDKKVLAKYGALTESVIKDIVVEKKWMAALGKGVEDEMQRISQRLTQRIKELAERYDTPLPELMTELTILEEKVNAHLVKMGFVWK